LNRAACQERVQTSYSDTVIVSAYEALYKDAVARNRQKI
jgi:hypothetical protein